MVYSINQYIRLSLHRRICQYSAGLSDWVNHSFYHSFLFFTFAGLHQGLYRFVSSNSSGDFGRFQGCDGIFVADAGQESLPLQSSRLRSRRPGLHPRNAGNLQRTSRHAKAVGSRSFQVDLQSRYIYQNILFFFFVFFVFFNYGWWHTLHSLRIS